MAPPPWVSPDRVRHPLPGCLWTVCRAPRCCRAACGAPSPGVAGPRAGPPGVARPHAGPPGVAGTHAGPWVLPDRVRAPGTAYPSVHPNSRPSEQSPLSLHPPWAAVGVDIWLRPLGGGGGPGPSPCDFSGEVGLRDPKRVIIDAAYLQEHMPCHRILCVSVSPVECPLTFDLSTTQGFPASLGGCTEVLCVVNTENIKHTFSMFRITSGRSQRIRGLGDRLSG